MSSPAVELAPTTRNGSGPQPVPGKEPESRPNATRRRLPDERPSITHRFSVGGHKGYITVGLYPNGQPGEVFVTMAKEGSSVGGFVSCFAQVVSVALQYDVPLEVFCDKFSHTRFEPSGFTGNPEIPMASSIMDYIFRWLRLRFSDKSNLPALAAPDLTNVKRTAGTVTTPYKPDTVAESSDAPLCRNCGSLTRRNGACFSCENCGSTTGCG